MDVIKLKDQKELVPASSFPCAKFPFEYLNPVQSRVFEIYKEDANFVIAASTSAGKTVVAEMILANEIREKGGKGIYLSPLRALSQEKIDDWSDKHHFSDLNLSICTGDYRLTANRKSELANADLIILTSEMLNSISRHGRSDKSQFLKECNTVVIDEVHLISSPERGPHVESGIMKFTELNPKARLVLLSATMPNVDELGEWVSHLNGRPTYVIESTYRPCPLYVHYERYYPADGYSNTERAKVEAALNIYNQHPQDKFLFFVHTKGTGEMMLEALNNRLIKAEFHNANLEKDKRKDIEKRFREDDSLRAIVATSTLAAGVNLPARRVVVLGVHRAFNDVEVGDITQSCGRAGRPRYDPAGDAYVLLPANQFTKYLAKLQIPSRIESQMSNALAFHLVSEIHHKNVQTLADVEEWWSRSLAAFQNKDLDMDVVDEVMTRLKKCGAVKEEEECFDATAIGQVSSLFYLSPYDVSDLCRNWTRLFDRGMDGDDLWIAMALANTETQRKNIVSAAEREEINQFSKKVNYAGVASGFGLKSFMESAIKAGCCFYKLLNGQPSMVLGGMMRTCQADFDRTIEVLNALDGMAGRWDKGEYFRKLGMRMQYGVPEEMLEICRLSGIGRAKAKKLWDANLRILGDVAENKVKVIKALGCSNEVAERICNEARLLK